MNAKEQRFADACAKGEALADAAKRAGYTLRYAERLIERADIRAEVAWRREEAETEIARRELKEYLLEVMRGKKDESDMPKIADRVRAAEFYEKYFESGAESTDDVVRVIVDYGD